MAEIRSTSRQEFKVILVLSEVEARALNAMRKYGHKSFLEGFYNKLGKSYMQPHEKGVISLFKTISEEMPQHLDKMDQSRKIFDPEYIKPL